MEELKYTDEELENLSKSELIAIIHGMKTSLDSVSHNMDLLLEQIRIMNQRTYGRRTESAVANPVFRQEALDLGFNEAEATADSEAQEPQLEETAPKKKKQSGRKEEFLKKITNHRDVNIGLSEEQLNEQFGKGKWKKIGEDLIQKLEHHPASFEAVTYHIGVYSKGDSQTIVRAQKPAELFPKSIATASLVSSIIFAKYVNAVPLYRQEQTYKANDIFISRNVMANWVIKAADEYLKYV